MYDIQITVSQDDIRQSLAEFEGFEGRALKLAKSRLDAAQVRHWEIVKNLPYSPGYVGRLKPSRQHRAGVSGDPGYAVDTGALYTDLTQSIFVDGDGIGFYSDQDYAAAQEALADAKGTSLIDDGQALSILEDATLEALGL